MKGITNNNLKTLSYLLTALLTWVDSSCIASTANGTLSVSALVLSNCTLSAATLFFGNYDPIITNSSSPLDGSTTFQIACTKGATVTVTLNPGLHAANAPAGSSRAMASNGTSSFLGYELYSDPGRTTLWSMNNPVRYTSTSSTPLSQTVYGRIPGGQNVQSGNYSDTVTITATF